MLSRDYNPDFIDDKINVQVGLGISPTVPEACEEWMLTSQGG